MMRKDLLIYLLLFLNVLPLSYASPQSSVHRGIALSAALSKAFEVCPEEASKNKKQIREEIHRLKAPLNVARDPKRKTYAANYQESPEMIDMKVQKICGFKNTVSLTGFEEATIDEGSMVEKPDDMSFEGEEMDESGFNNGSMRSGLNTNGLVVFGIGLALGILLSYLFLKNQALQAQVSMTMKGVRRPEL
ncbi:unnamed protein product [Bathycoccus prasinos]